MKFRLVYFTPDPFRGERFVVGAMVGDGKTARFERGSLPGQDCIGGKDSWITLQMSLDTLTSIDRFEPERGVASQLISFSDPRPMPADADAEWVRRVFLTRWRDVRDVPGVAAQQEQRGVFGNRFFEQWKVMRYIKHRFDLSQYVEVPGGLPQLPHKPTHWVKGRDRVLLMEPVVGTRASLADDLKQIGASMLAHLKLFELAKAKAQPEMIAYVFSNGYRGTMSETRESLNQIVKVIDVEKPMERDRFIEHIREVGTTEPSLFG